MKHSRSGQKSRVAVIGYGSQGRAIALNLQDSDWPVTVGLRGRSRHRALAKQDGISRILGIAEAVAESEIVAFAFPDHLHGRVYQRSILPHLNKGVTLWFLHGTAIHFGYVTPPDHADVVMIAPHAPGPAVREKYLGDRSVSAFFAVAQNRSKRAKATINSLADGIGINSSRLVKTTFEDEAVGDLFGEQAVLCGGLAMLIKTGFEVLIEHGLKPEHAYLEVAYQLDLIIALIKKHGIEGMFSRISVAARYGSLKAGPALITPAVKKRMKRLLDSIVSGSFPRELEHLEPADIQKLNKAIKTLSHPALERAARKFAHK